MGAKQFWTWAATSVASAVMMLAPAGVGQAADAAAQPSSAPAAAPSYAPFQIDSPWLFGDWHGYRSDLKARGIDFQFAYGSETAYNATGGTRNLVRYTDQWVGGVTLDLDKLAGIPNATFQTTLVERTGRNLSADAHLNTLQLVQEVYGRGQTLRLVQFWYDQTFFDKAVDWKIGRIAFGEDFGAFSCDFQNLTFCGGNAGNIVGNYIYNWPISQWATRVKVNIKDFGYVQVGAFDANPNYLDLHEAALPVWYPGSTGVIVPLEVGWTPTFATLPGSYKFGGWYDTSNGLDVVTDINGNPMQITGLPAVEHRGRYGGYINFQQQITHGSGANAKSGLTVFLNAVMADRRTATTDAQIAGGLWYTGLFPSRPIDDIMFAVGATHVNTRVADVEALQNALGLGPVGVQHTEYVLEADYSWRPLASVTIRPNIQYIIDPGGVSKSQNALVFGLKTAVTF